MDRHGPWPRDDEPAPVIADYRVTTFLAMTAARQSITLQPQVDHKGKASLDASKKSTNPASFAPAVAFNAHSGKTTTNTFDLAILPVYSEVMGQGAGTSASMKKLFFMQSWLIRSMSHGFSG